MNFGKTKNKGLHVFCRNTGKGRLRDKNKKSNKMYTNFAFLKKIEDFGHSNRIKKGPRYIYIFLRKLSF